MTKMDEAIKIATESFISDYSNRKEQILSFIKTNTDKFEINIDYIQRKDCENILNGEVDQYSNIKITEHGIDCYCLNEDIVNEIVASIPTSIKKLKVSYEYFKSMPNLLNRFENLESLELVGLGSLKMEDLKRYISNNKLKTIDCELLLDNAFKRSKIVNIKPGEKRELQFGNLTVKTSASSFGDTIVFNDDLKSLSSFLKQGDIDESRYKVQFYRNSNKVLEYNIEKKKVDIVLNDNIEESLLLLEEFKNSTGLDYDSIIIHTDNRSYDNMDALYKFEQLGNVEINYGALYTANISQFINMRSTLDYYVSLINQNDLSPLEKLCYAYDLIKSNEYTDDEVRGNSRYIHNIVESGKIVCFGYSAFLAQLLKEIGIKAYAIGTSVPTENGTLEGHERNIVEIYDEKYGVHGKFSLDCTYDSNCVIYKVVRDNNILLVNHLAENDEILEQYDSMSSYRDFLIPAQDYPVYYPGEEFYQDVREWHGDLYDPNQEPLVSLDQKNEQSTPDLFEETSIDEETIISVIYNTRQYEGYSKEQNDKLIEEVKELREKTKPKELVCDFGIAI